MDETQVVRIVREEIPDLIALYRFGSSVEGFEHATSDVDLAVLAPHPLDPKRRFQLQERLAAALRRDVDLVDLRTASTVMRMQVIGRGREIAVFDEARRGQFEDLVYTSYARLNEERRAIVEQVKRDGSVHGR